MIPPSAHEHSSRCWWNHEIAGWVCPPERTAVLPEQVRGETEVTAGLVGAVTDLP